MELSEDLQDKIDKYFNKQLKPDESSEFENALKVDKDLKQEVDLQRKAVAAINLWGDRQFKDKLDQFHEDMERKRRFAKDRSFYKISGIAASLLIILCLVVFFIYNKNKSPEKLFAQYYSPENYIFLRSESGVSSEGGVFFNEGDYKNAAEAFKSAIRSKTGTYQDHFFLGLSYIELGEETLAKNYLGQVAEKSNPYQAKALWYIALIHLKEGNAEECKNILRNIKEDPYNAHYQSAKKLLEDLK